MTERLVIITQIHSQQIQTLKQASANNNKIDKVFQPNCEFTCFAISTACS